MKSPPAEFTIEEDPFFAEDLRQMAQARNYRRWQFSLISPYVRGKVLEVGGGIGNFTPVLARVAESVISLEPNVGCFRQLLKNTQSLPNVTAFQTTAESLNTQLPADYRADTLVCMNVLEHIQNDQAAVADFDFVLEMKLLEVIASPDVEAGVGAV